MMELTTPGPLSEQLSLHEKQSTENSIVREHLNFDYSNTLNGDKLLKTEVGDTPNSENTLSKDAELSVEKEKEHKQIFSDTNLDLNSSNENINESPSNIDGSLQGDTNTKIFSKKEDLGDVKSLELLNNISKTNESTSEDKERCSSDIETSDINSNGPKDEIASAHQDEASNQNSNENSIGKYFNNKALSGKHIWFYTYMYHSNIFDNLTYSNL